MNATVTGLRVLEHEAKNKIKKTWKTQYQKSHTEETHQTQKQTKKKHYFQAFTEIQYRLKNKSKEENGNQIPLTGDQRDWVGSRNQ